jgi:hypothetical protein
MINYSINSKNIFLPLDNGETIVLSITQNSGRIVYRDKINTLIGIKHPGIELGTDSQGYRWFVHHHYKNIKPSIEREDSFSLGELIFYDSRKVNYNQYKILERSLLAWWFGNEYHWLWQNCQHFVNEVSKGVSHSETIERVSDNSMIGGGIATLIGILAGNKTLTNIGLAVAVGGAVGKGFSKLK